MSYDPGKRRSDLRAVAKAISAEVGAETLRALHREDRRLDVLTVAGLWAVIGALFYLLGTLPFGIAWLALFVLQGFALQCLGFCAHDLFLHRRVGGERLSRALGMACLAPLLITMSGYKASHLDHHWFLGTDHDGEVYKQDLDRRWVKLLLLLGPTSFLVFARVFRREDCAAPVVPERSPDVAARIRHENWLLLAFLALVAVAACFWPRLVIAGYVLPALLSLQWASAVRLILEHGEMSLDNAYHAATCHVADPVSGALFLWGTGDGHLIHHLFPNIPLYRLLRARAALLPVLVRHGVVVRTSVPWLLYQWFVRNRRHATVWS